MNLSKLFIAGKKYNAALENYIRMPSSQKNVVKPELGRAEAKMIEALNEVVDAKVKEVTGVDYTPPSVDDIKFIIDGKFEDRIDELIIHLEGIVDDKLETNTIGKVDDTSAIPEPTPTPETKTDEESEAVDLL